MEKIEPKDMKIGDFIYIIETLFNEKRGNRRFILKFNTEWWKLKNISKKLSIFDPIENKGDYVMLEEDWEHYKAYKLNKKEIGKFNKLQILNNL